MIEAVESDSVRDVVRQFSRYKDSLKDEYRNGYVPMHAAARHASAFMVELLFRLGATDLEVKDKRGCTPLMYAIRCSKHKAVVKKLIELGARLDCRSLSNRTLFHCAALRPDTWPVKFLIKHLKDFQVRDNEGLTAFDVAARHEHYEVANILCEYCDCENKDNAGQTLVHYAAGHDKPKLVDFVDEHNLGNFHDAKPNGSTAVHVAVRHSVRVLERLIVHDFDVDAQDSHGRTPMHRAVEYPFLDNPWPAICMLWNAGSRALWIEDNDGRRPIDYAHPHHAERLRELFFSRSLLSTLLFIDREIKASKRQE